MVFDHVDDLTLLDSGVRIHLVEDPQAWNMSCVAVSVVPISIFKSKKIKHQWLLECLKNSFIKKNKMRVSWNTLVAISEFIFWPCLFNAHVWAWNAWGCFSSYWMKIIASVWYFYSDLKIELKSLLVVYGFPSLTACPKGHSKVLCLHPVKNVFELYVLAVLVLEFNRNCISIRTRSQGP